MPKRNSEDSRPVGVGSILLRSFNSIVLNLLPCPPSGQWGGRIGVSDTHATVDWLDHPGSVGAGLDLSKAFDLIDWNVANVSLCCCWVGASCSLVDFLSLWSFVSLCFGQRSSSLARSHSVTASSGSLLGLCWWSLLKKAVVPSSLTLLFLLLKILIVLLAWKKTRLNANFGRSISVLLSNIRAFLLTPFPISYLLFVKVILLEALPLLAHLPGGLVVREAAVRTFFKGNWCWPLPLLGSPSADIVVAFRRALCSWWGPGRFWADRIALGSAMACLRFPGPPSSRLLAAVIIIITLTVWVSRLPLGPLWLLLFVFARLVVSCGTYSLTCRYLIMVRLGFSMSIVMRALMLFGLLPAISACALSVGAVSILKVLQVSTLMPVLIEHGPLGVWLCLASISFCLLSFGVY